MGIKIYEDLEEARRTVLRRREMTTVDDVPEVVLDGIRRIFGEALTPEAAVARMVADVRARGDVALREWTRSIDGIELEELEVPQEAWTAAYKALDPELCEALEFSAVRIRDFHIHQPIPSWTTDTMGGTLGQRLTPIRSAGVYVPGGTAPLPSSLLMTAIPARAAGVDEIIVCSPAAGPEGEVNAMILAAAHIVGVDRVYRLGGALAAILLGPWVGTLVITAVLVVQALLFQDGGLIALGANVFNMAVVGVWVGYGAYWLLGRVVGSGRVGSLVRGFAAGWISVGLAALCCAIELAISGTSAWGVAIPAMAGVHALIGIGEGLITAAVLAFVAVARPDLLRPMAVAEAK